MMLAELRIENFALIDKLELHLTSGLNVLSGETGAGKSIIIDAVSLLLGGRSSQELIRSGAERALVEGLFFIRENTQLFFTLVELGYEPEEGNFVLNREISLSGRNICRIQGRTVPLSVYKEIGSSLIDIHGQHDYQSLLRPENHLLLLDSLNTFSGEILERVGVIANEIASLSSSIAAISGDERDAARREDMLRFQLEEIEAAKLELGEDEGLEQERIKLTNIEKLDLYAKEGYEYLFSGSQRQKSALDLLRVAVEKLRALSALDQDTATMLEIVEGSYYQLEEVGRDLRDYQENINADPTRLGCIDDRLAQIKALKRKYGGSIEEIKEFYDRAKNEFTGLTSLEENKKQLELELAAQLTDYESQSGKLTKKRLETAGRLEQTVANELAELYMPDTQFRVDFRSRNKVHKLGADLVEFMISANPGEPLKPLTKTASGGELSRVVLALKTILAKVDPVPTLIFDEVDSGVAGQAVLKVAEKLAAISIERQVLCVTHSPHLASHARSHFSINKESVAGRTVTRVVLLEENDRQAEIARMLGGSSSLALEHAADLLKSARAK